MVRSVRDEVCTHVYERFPPLAGVRPTVERAGANRIYTFQRAVKTSPGGPSVRHIVRVTVDASGEIVKLVASR